MGQREEPAGGKARLPAPVNNVCTVSGVLRVALSLQQAPVLGTVGPAVPSPGLWENLQWPVIDSTLQLHHCGGREDRWAGGRGGSKGHQGPAINTNLKIGL